MIDYLFKDKTSGEEFIVQAENLDCAWEIVADWFDAADVKYICELDEITARASGLDTY